LAFLIDSSILIAYERAQKSPGALLLRLGDHPVAIAAITASEILHGVHRADSRERRAVRNKFVETLLAAVPVLPYTLDVARVHAELWADLEARGEPIKVHDALIAATSLAHSLILLTSDRRHFQRVRNLEIEVW